mmetsp:Transcript_99898/g.187957  ORF Transcript_99898/g.187957 Transcript_99898/m.187957 type:complete len:665 (-) Transcript_99898:87-2081(-)
MRLAAGTLAAAACILAELCLHHGGFATATRAPDADLPTLRASRHLALSSDLEEFSSIAATPATGASVFQVYMSNGPRERPSTRTASNPFNRLREAVMQPREHLHELLLFLPVLLGFALVLLSMFSLVDFSGSRRSPAACDASLSVASAGDGASFSTASVCLSSSTGALQPWSVSAIMALTSYRFYTGFLSATWMPYLLAMEGHELMGERQSFFMGSAKLIYGLSILLNPLFGLVGDQVATWSHWSGRRFFILAGVAMSGLGIYGCLVAANLHSVRLYLVGTVLWMLGEAIADVTTETLVPELLPRSQYEISSSIRALNFLLGGLLGYTMLLILRNTHYSWVYYGYLIVMLICAFLSLSFINTEDRAVGTESSSLPARRSSEQSIMSLVAQAYLMPARLEGGFPRACLCLFIFSLGSAPMFFLFLMIRDIINVKNQAVLQMHFSIISIVFFICAAIAASVGAVSSSSTDGAGAAESAIPRPPEVLLPRKQVEAMIKAAVARWKTMVLSTVAFGVVCAAIPVVGLFPKHFQRVVSFYMLAALFGAAFGSVYARFQDCTWSLLRPGVDIANAMGYAAMCKLAGVGIGNFLAGIMLDFYASGSNSYEYRGYVIMCAFCALVVFISAALAYSVGRMAVAEMSPRRKKAAPFPPPLGENGEWSQDVRCPR